MKNAEKLLESAVKKYLEENIPTYHHIFFNGVLEHRVLPRYYHIPCRHPAIRDGDIELGFDNIEFPYEDDVDIDCEDL